MSAVACAPVRAGESKETTKEEIVLRDGCHYIRGLKITGVAWLTRNGKNHASFCQENRVALTKDEQKAIGDKQPFMLPTVTFDPQGKIIEDSILVDAYNQKMKSKGKDVTVTATQAKEYCKRFKARHFPMAILREAIKGDEHPKEALRRGIQEECKRVFRENVDIPEHTFVYERRGNSCLLVYFVEKNMLRIDLGSIKRTGPCNYFCAKSLDGIIENDYLETRNHEMLENDEIEKRLLEFQNTYGENGIGCDLKYWGGLKMWDECKKHF